MKRTGTHWMIFVAVAVAMVGLLSSCTLFRHSDETENDGQSVTEDLIRLNGGVEVVFGAVDGTPSLDEDQLNAAKAVLQKRLVLQDILNADIRVDEGQLILRVPLGKDEELKVLQRDVMEAGRLGQVVFRMGDEEILASRDMVSAKAVYDEEHDVHMVQVTLTESGKAAFAAATTEQVNKGTISVWLDDQMVCNPTVNAPITDGVAAFPATSSTEAQKLASIISSGPLPVTLEVKSSQFLASDMVAEAG